MASLALLIHSEVLQPQLLLGASMMLTALIGFEMVMQYVQWRGTQHSIARRQLRVLVTIVIVQSCVDLMIEQVSFTGHLVGFIWGGVFGLGYVMLKCKSFKVS